jgi:hypothetical protein
MKNNTVFVIAPVLTLLTLLSLPSNAFAGIAKNPANHGCLLDDAAPIGTVEIAATKHQTGQATSQSYWMDAVGVTLYVNDPSTNKLLATIGLNWPTNHAQTGTCKLSAGNPQNGEAVVVAVEEGSPDLHTATSWDAPDLETHEYGQSYPGTGTLDWTIEGDLVSVTFKVRVYRNTSPGHNESWLVSGHLTGIKRSPYGL